MSSINNTSNETNQLQVNMANKNNSNDKSSFILNQIREQIITKEISKIESRLPDLSLNTLKSKVWDIFSFYVRLVGADENGYNRCFTCGAYLPIKDLQAGHGIQGRTNAILFDEDIVKPQCVKCNLYLAGNYDVFHVKLIQVYGPEWLSNKIIHKKQAVKFTKSDLLELYTTYMEKVALSFIQIVEFSLQNSESNSGQSSFMNFDLTTFLENIPLKWHNLVKKMYNIIENIKY